MSFCEHGTDKKDYSKLMWFCEHVTNEKDYSKCLNCIEDNSRLLMEASSLDICVKGN